MFSTPNTKGYRKAYHPNRGQRRTNALIRQEVRSKRSDREQLQYLEDRGHGHCKEAEKLREQFAKSSTKAA